MSYSATLTTSLDKVRFHIGDTSNVAASELLADGEIAYILTEETSIYRASAVAAEAIAAKFARLADTSVGDVSVSNSQKHTQYLALSKVLYRKASGRAAPAFLGGASISDRDTRNSDTDNPIPFFSRTSPGDDRRIDELTRDYVG